MTLRHAGGSGDAKRKAGQIRNAPPEGGRNGRLVVLSGDAGVGEDLRSCGNMELFRGRGGRG